MEIIKTHKLSCRVDRTFDLRSSWVDVYIEESKTNYYVTIKVVGYALPSVLGWKVSKKVAKCPNRAAEIIIDEARFRKNL